MLLKVFRQWSEHFTLCLAGWGSGEGIINAPGELCGGMCALRLILENEPHCTQSLGRENPLVPGNFGGSGISSVWEAGGRSPLFLGAGVEGIPIAQGRGISITPSARGGGSPLLPDESRLHPAPDGGGNPSLSRSRDRAPSPSLLEPVRVALSRGPPAASIPEASWAEGGLGSPFSFPPSRPAGALPWDAPAAPGSAPGRRAGVKGSRRGAMPAPGQRRGSG